MKLKDTRGLPIEGEFAKFVYHGAIMVNEDGTETVRAPDVVEYVKEEYISAYFAIKDHVIRASEGYSEYNEENTN